MASLQSKLWKYFLSPFYSKKANASAKLNIRLSRLIESPEPPVKILKQNLVTKLKIGAGTIFSLVPRNIHTDKIIFYLHGGAYITGITWPHWLFVNKIASRAGIQIEMVEYPVAPENHYIDTIDVVLAAYQHLLDEYLPSQIIFMGDSAGGGLALALAQYLKQKDLPQPAGIVLLSPWLDVTMGNEEIEILEKKDSLLSKKALIAAGEFYARGADRKNPLISPIYGDFAGLAEINLFIGTHDLLLADARKLNQQMKNAASPFHYYEFEGMFHVWMFFPLPEAKKVLSMIYEIIAK